MDYEKIFEALYLLNKSAKKSRDTQNKAMRQGKQTVAKRSKFRKDYLYKIKHLALKKLEEEDKIKFIGIHKQDVNDTSFYLAYYKSSDGRFKYHRPATKKEIKLYENNDIEKMTVVPAEVKHKHSVSFSEGIILLLEYIEKDKEDIKKLLSEKFFIK